MSKYILPEGTEIKEVMVKMYRAPGGQCYQSKDMAEYAASIGRECETCGEPTRKGYILCDECRAKREHERFLDLPEVPYTGQAVCLNDGDKYFWGPEDILDYCHEKGIEPEALGLVEAVQGNMPVFDVDDYLCDVLGEGSYIDDADSINERVNEILKEAEKDLAYQPTKNRVKVTKKDIEYNSRLTEERLTPPFKPQFIANLLEKYIARDEDGMSMAYQHKPEIVLHKWGTLFNYLWLPDGLIDWGDIDWKDSLTVPDSRKEEHDKE